MGILREPAAFVKALNLPSGFSVCELGDQWMAGLKKPQIASAWYRSMGCGRYESIDGNGKGTLTADLNLPIALHVERYRVGFSEAFDLVTDFGTGEHIFDQAQVWRTLHDLTKPGGYIAIDRPSQGYPEHCYYRIDPCLFDDLAKANRYRVVKRETGATPRGELIRCIFQKLRSDDFRIPQQGRYRESLVVA